MSETAWLALFLPRLTTDRLIRSGAAPEGRALAIYAKEANAFRLTGVDARASALGLQLAMSLADARAIHPDLAALEAEPEEDARALDAIAAWCERFTPIVVLDPPNGLLLDITGCGHLFGDEAALRDLIVARLQAQGFAARAALAPTPGAAWALARYGRENGAKESSSFRGIRRSFAKADEPGTQGVTEQSVLLLGSASALRASRNDEITDIGIVLAPLPIEALRLEAKDAALLRRLGLKSVGQLIDRPRAPFAARAGEHAMLRLDQALGRTPEALSPRRPPPPVFALRRFLEPLFNIETILIATERLCLDAIEKLEQRGAGLLRGALHLYGVDGRDRVIEVGASRPMREVKALMRLFREKLNRAAENLDAEFGIEAARLDVVQIERIGEAARTLVSLEEAAASAEQIDAIVDVLSARLGPARVLRPKLASAHAPERAGGWRSALRSAKLAVNAPPPSDGVMRRPLTVFARPQPIETLATVPDGPPIRFRWRRVLRDVVRAEGPERISGDWIGGAAARDYYRVEDKQGRRYWLYREGLYGEGEEAPRWFVHGLFA